jgi:Polyketide cyclase / dehydrase and lipid transport
MDDITWELEHTVEAAAGAAFVWAFWTNVANWDDPPAQFALEGPFAAGARGTTVMPGEAPRAWTISAVEPGAAFTLEMALEGATLSFTWRFEALAEDRTRLTQRIVLAGENATSYLDAVRAGFGGTLADGMKRVAALIEAAARTRP